jgi:N-acetylglutamate synthase-like GNAT family acetyltransferase
MEIVVVNDYTNIVKLAKSFGMFVHDLSNVIKAWEARIDGKFVGSVVLRSDGEYYELDLFAVKEELHGKGIGTKIFNTLVDDVKQLGGKEIYIISRHAREFYLKKNFVDISISDFPSNLMSCDVCGKRKRGECNPSFMKLVL